MAINEKWLEMLSDEARADVMKAEITETAATVRARLKEENETKRAYVKEKEATRRARVGNDGFYVIRGLFIVGFVIMTSILGYNYVDDKKTVEMQRLHIEEARLEFEQPKAVTTTTPVQK